MPFIKTPESAPNLPRAGAGYCWNWNSKKNPSLNDIVIPSHHYSARWNLAAERNSWIISPTGVEEVGCVHTCQGLEVDTIGVIIGPDLVVRDGQLLVDPTARARSDKSLSGWRADLATDPEGTRERVSRLIRNTYRTLMSRGMRSCWVFACDEVLQEYLRKRMNESQAMLPQVGNNADFALNKLCRFGARLGPI